MLQFRLMAARVITTVRAVAFAAFALPAAAANLAVGLGTDVTAIDPHYHNLTPNNNVAAHIFGYLVERNEKSQLQPGLATEWKTIDPLTWEFKLRKGVKFHDGSDFTAADVVASIERVPTVPNSPSPFTAYHEADQGDRRRRSADDPLQDRDALSADALGHDAGRDHLEGRGESDDRRLQHRQGGDRHRSLQARPLREERSHRARAKRRLLGRQDAVGEGDAAAPAAGCVPRRGAPVRRRAGHRERADLRRRGAAEGQAPAGLPHGRRPADLPPHGQRPRRLAVRDRQGRASRSPRIRSRIRACGRRSRRRSAGGRWWRR